MPYRDLHETMRAKAELDAAPFMTKIGLHPILGNQHASSVSALHVWHNSSKTVHDIKHTAFPWTMIWRTNQATTLSDSDFDFALGLMTDSLTPRRYKCPIDHQDIGTLTPYAYTRHILSCLHCGAPAFHLRHEYVNNALHKVFKFHGMHSTLNPTDLPRPQNTKGGADLILYSDQIYAIDVAITAPTQRQLNQRYAFKMRTYAEFSSLTKFATFPFVMDATGRIHHSTSQMLRSIAQNENNDALVRDARVHTLFALFKGQRLGIDVLHARSHTQLVESPSF